MGERIERIARVLHRLNVGLSPPQLRRLDRWLLVHRALVWRTRVHWIVWWSLVAATCLTILATLTYKTPADAPPPESFHATVFGILYTCMFVGVMWSILQMRTPVGEVSMLRHAKLLALNTLAILCLLAPTGAFVAAATFGVARSMPDGEFANARRFHEGHDYWACHYGSEQHQGDRVSADALAVFGLSAEKDLEPCDSSSATGGYLTLSSSASVNLKARLDGIRCAKELWSRGSGDYFDAYVEPALLAVGGAALVSALLGAISLPAYIWRRAFSGMKLPRWSTPHGKGFPGLLARMDHWLLLRWPLFWATRIHAHLWFLICGCVVWTVLRPLASRLLGASRPSFTACFLIAGAWPWLWLWFRRHDLAAGAARRWRPLVAGFLSAAYLTPVLLAAAAKVIRWDVTLSEIFRDDVVGPAAASAVVGPLVATTFCSLRTYETRVTALATVMSGTFAMFVAAAIALFPSSHGGVWVLFGCWAGLSTLLLAYCKYGTVVNRFQRIGALFMIVATPIVLLVAFIAAIADGPGDLIKWHPWLSGAAIVVVACWAYVQATAPFARVLARAKFEPNAQ